ncbi:hypothetical protein [Haloarchaeobius sp. HRN-SO-5]|uniref:hypothetical protein n=1 Tax=Haloarchaeobius sp. HRN-SO-5 TaxID=3446118 RepID=UPI003EC148BF
MTGRSYDGPALDYTWQSITERPELDDDDTVYCTPAEPEGEETTENVPVPDLDSDADGQTTFEDWGWSV